MAGTSKRGRPPHPDVLTPAEWRIVDAVRHGMSNRTIARQRGISIDAVKFHVENAVAKLGLANRTELRQWRGAPFDSALAGKENDTMNAGLQLGRVGQISREVRDLGRAVEWFRDTLGLPLLGHYGNLATFDMGGVRLFISHHEEGNGAGHSIVYFLVDNIDAAYEELAQRGITFRGAPHMIFRHPNGIEEWMAFFEDMDGELLAIMSQVEP
ncbi:MAG TPA: LuxR C-terminal-related transcriptional regulator [Gammaproteobacteria bacterium]|nr:LuxR C-terminal-related transcriptional regulator [Gammaproteobacteria bacterium]